VLQSTVVQLVISPLDMSWVTTWVLTTIEAPPTRAAIATIVTVTVIPLVNTAAFWHILVQLGNATTTLEGLALVANSSHIQILLAGMVSQQVTPRAIL
jgi:hypothetical protein